MIGCLKNKFNLIFKNMFGFTQNARGKILKVSDIKADPSNIILGEHNVPKSKIRDIFLNKDTNDRNNVGGSIVIYLKGKHFSPERLDLDEVIAVFESNATSKVMEIINSTKNELKEIRFHTPVIRDYKGFLKGFDV